MPQAMAVDNTEVLVIDASPPQALSDIRQEFPSVKWEFYSSDSVKKITIPEQRNLGIDKSKGKVILFLDANCTVEDNWLQNMQCAFLNQDQDIVTGPIRSVGGKTLHDKGYQAFKDNQPIPECGAANLGIKKDILQKLGMFDSCLSYGEDLDLAWRARRAGYKIIFKDQIIIYHDWGALPEEIRRAFRYGTSRTMVYKKHPYNWRNLFGYDMDVLVYPAYLLLMPVTLLWQYYPLFILIPLIRNIGNNPFKKTSLHLIYAAGAIKGLVKGL
jgi:GT2 family glycosyltransferase